MKKIMVAAAALSMLGGVAFAQNAPTATTSQKKAVKKEAKVNDASTKKVEKKEATVKHAQHHAKHVQKAEKPVEQSAE